MKKFLSLILAFSLLITSVVSFAEPTYNDYENSNYNTKFKKVGLVFNGKVVSNDVPSILYDERALVPIRFLTENMGFDVKWDNSDQSISVSSDKKLVKLWIDKNEVVVDGIVKSIDYGVSPKLIESNTMVPLRFMAEIFNADVEWDNNSFSAIINYNPTTEDTIPTVVKNKQLNLPTTKVQFGTIDFDKYFPSVVYNGKSFVSLRSMSEATGTDLNWNGNDNSITITTPDKELYFRLDSDIVLVNGIEKNIGFDSAPILMSRPKSEFSSTMVPLRFIVEELGYTLSWDAESWTSNISFSEKSKSLLNDISFSEISSGIESLTLYLDSITSPKLSLNENVINISIPNTSVDIDGNKSYNYIPKNFPLNFVDIEEINENTIVKIGFDKSINIKKYFDGNNLVIKFELPAQEITYTDYNLTFDEMVEVQVAKKPVTDKYADLPVYIKKSDVKITGLNKGVTLISTDLKSENTSYSHTYATLNSNKSIDIKKSVGDYYEIVYTEKWRFASRNDIRSALSISGLEIGSSDSFKYLDLSKPAGISADVVNSKILTNKGILTDKGTSYIEASKLYNINEIYLMAHSILETGNGSSELANGILVSEVDGKSVTPKKVYNMYGIGAVDSSPLKGGSETAYKEGWDTPEKAIVGGAKFVSEKYINNPGNNQNTIYEMRWDHNTKGASYLHQYATDIDWANKQVNNIKHYYDLLDDYVLCYDIPRYK